MKKLVKLSVNFLLFTSMIVLPNLMMKSKITNAIGISKTDLKTNSLVQLTSSGAEEIPGEFTSSGPYGGRTRGLAIDPTDSNTVFVAVEMAGLFRTVDGGQNWEHILFSGVTPIGFVEIKPDEPTVIFFGGQDGLYRSDQGGDIGSWNKVLIPDSQHHQPNALAISPSTPDQLFCAINGSVYFSDDAGQTWQKRGNGLPGEPNYLSVDFDNEAQIYAGYSFGDLYKSDNSGTEWNKIAEFPLVDGIGGITVLVIDPHVSKSLWIGTSQNGLYRSIDSGATFVKVASLDNVIDIGDNPRNVSLFGFCSISFDPGLKRIFIGAAGPGSAIFYTDYDEGDEASWPWIGLGLNNAGGADIVIAPDNNNILYTTWAGVRKSTDGGENWEYQSNGISGLQFQQIAISPHNPVRAIAVAGSDGAFSTSNGGNTWEAIYVMDSGFGHAHHLSVAFDPINPNIAYLDGSEVYKTINDGVNWSQTGTLEIPSQYNFLFARPHSLAVHPLDPETIFAGIHFIGFDNIEIFDGGLYRSIDGGESWKLALKTNHPILRVAVSASHPNIIYLGSGLDSHAFSGNGIWRSNDSGQSWVNKNNQLEGLTTLALAIHPENPNLILVGVLFGANDGDGIYRSTNGGDSWEKAGGLFTHTELKVPDIVFDPLDPSIVYAATHGGLRVSFDTGLTWQVYPGPMGQVPITTLAATVDEGLTRLYIGTVGGKVSGGNGLGITNRAEKVVSAGIYVGLSNLNSINRHYLPLIIH